MNITHLSSIIPANNIQNVKTKGFNFASYAQKPDSFERSCPVAFTGKSNKINEYTKVIDTLKTTCDSAQVSLNGQLASDGWAGKTADFVSGLWCSKNRAHIVQSDIDNYKTQIKSLDDSIKTDTFKQKFIETFGVEYQPSKIRHYNKSSKDFKAAVTTMCIAEITETKLSKELNIFKNNKGILKERNEKVILPNVMTGSVPYYYNLIPKEKVLEDMEKSLIDVVGSKDVLNNVLQKNGLDTNKATVDEKYKAYGLMADYLIESSKEAAKKCSKGKTLVDLKNEYEKNYKDAYGNRNDIQERVDKYNRSQEIGAATVRGIARSGLSAALMLTAPAAGFGKILASAVTTFGVKVVVDGSDKMTNHIDNSIDLDSASIKKLIRSSAISAAENFASNGLNEIIPNFNTGNDIIDFGLEQGKGVIIDTSLGMISERFKQGKWNEDQIIPRMVISAVFRNLGTDSELIKELLKLTKGGINQAMKKRTRDYDIVQQFIRGTKITLNEDFLKDSKVFGDLKLYATAYPKQYEEMMADILQKQIDEIVQNQDKTNNNG